LEVNIVEYLDINCLRPAIFRRFAPFSGTRNDTVLGPLDYPMLFIYAFNCRKYKAYNFSTLAVTVFIYKKLYVICGVLNMKQALVNTILCRHFTMST